MTAGAEGTAISGGKGESGAPGCGVGSTGWKGTASCRPEPGLAAGWASGCADWAGRDGGCGARTRGGGETGSGEAGAMVSKFLELGGLAGSFAAVSPSAPGEAGGVGGASAGVAGSG